MVLLVGHIVRQLWIDPRNYSGVRAAHCAYVLGCQFTSYGVLYCLQVLVPDSWCCEAIAPSHHFQVGSVVAFKEYIFDLVLLTAIAVHLQRLEGEVVVKVHTVVLLEIVNLDEGIIQDC